MASIQTPHIVFLSISLPFTIPMLELAKLSVERGFTATIIVLTDVSDSHPQDHFIQSHQTNGISFQTVPPLPLQSLPSDCPLEHRFAVTAELCSPFVFSILNSLKQTNNVVAFVADVMSALNNIALAKTLGVPSFVFCTSSITAFSYASLLPILDQKMTGEYRHLTEPLQLDGCVKLNGSDYFFGTQDRSGLGHKALVRMFGSYRDADGVLLNSFIELEPGPYKALKEKENKGQVPKLYTVGPIVPLKGWGDDADDCLKWLDRQPDESVLFIALSSGGSLTAEQTGEIAYGLEKSGQRFLWVVRHSSEKNGSGAFFKLKFREDELDGLPDGFVERTRGRGFVVRHWAPQVRVLGHKAVGGFMNICGWTSVLESVCFGVPLIALPLFAEQRMNGVVLCESVGVALRLTVGEDGKAGRDDVAEVVKELFGGADGARVRAKAKELHVAAGKTVAPGGPSYGELGKWCDSLLISETTV